MRKRVENAASYRHHNRHRRFDYEALIRKTGQHHLPGTLVVALAITRSQVTLNTYFARVSAGFCIGNCLLCCVQFLASKAAFLCVKRVCVRRWGVLLPSLRIPLRFDANFHCFVTLNPSNYTFDRYIHSLVFTDVTFTVLCFGFLSSVTSEQFGPPEAFSVRMDEIKPTETSPQAHSPSAGNHSHTGTRRV